MAYRDRSWLSLNLLLKEEDNLHLRRSLFLLSLCLRARVTRLGHDLHTALRSLEDLGLGYLLYVFLRGDCLDSQIDAL